MVEVSCGYWVGVEFEDGGRAAYVMEEVTVEEEFLDGGGVCEVFEFFDGAPDDAVGW